MKIALVSPLYKAKDPMYFSNYRSISLLSTFSKILERLMYNRIIDFLNKHKILNKYQFGFRTNHSTYMALIILLENLMKALENCESAIGILLDFQKAFDAVNHSILLDTLCIYGIRGPALSWITSYLSNRCQYVVYNGYESECKSPWVAIQASRCAGRVDRILAVKNPGVSLRPSYENGGWVVPPGTITVLLQDIPGEKGSLPIRYTDLIRPMYWVSFVGI